MRIPLTCALILLLCCEFAVAQSFRAIPPINHPILGFPLIATEVSAVANGGVAVVGDGLTASERFGFLWRPVEGSLALTPIDGIFYTVALDLSRDGTQALIGVGFNLAPYRWSSSGGASFMGTLNGIAVTPGAISADGSAAVTFSGTTRPTGRWRSETGWQALSGLPGRTRARTSDLSSDGSYVVGRVFNSPFLARYLKRSPLSLERTTLLDSALSPTIRITKKLDDGDIHRDFSPLEFLAELQQHIPDMWEQTTRYFGKYAARTRATERRQDELKQKQICLSAPLPTEQPSELPEPPPKASSSWAAMIKRIYEIDPLACSKCGGKMKIIAFLQQEKEINKLCENLGYPKF